MRLRSRYQRRLPIAAPRMARQPRLVNLCWPPAPSVPFSHPVRVTSTTPSLRTRAAINRARVQPRQATANHPSKPLALSRLFVPRRKRVSVVLPVPLPERNQHRSHPVAPLLPFPHRPHPWTFPPLPPVPGSLRAAKNDRAPQGGHVYRPFLPLLLGRPPSLVSYHHPKQTPRTQRRNQTLPRSAARARRFGSRPLRTSSCCPWQKKWMRTARLTSRRRCAVHTHKPLMQGGDR